MTAALPDSRGRVRSALRLWAQPVAALLLGVAVLVWGFSQELTETQRATVNWDSILTLIGEHLVITVIVAVLVLGIAIPLGIVLSRPAFRRAEPVVLALANIGQSAPAVGLIVLFYLLTGLTGVWAGVIPIVAYSLLPVLRNTILGFNSVDPLIIDAARGQGLSARGILTAIELPLAVPFILAGLRTTLVIAVGTATLAFLVDAGGLGILIDTGYKLRDNVALIVGSLLAVSLALFVDALGGIAEKKLGPRGLV